MVTFRFSKARVEHFLNSVRCGDELIAGPDGWTGAELLVLAGVCLYVVISTRPLTEGAVRMGIHAEHAEARRNTLLHELFTTIDLCGRLTMLVADAKYDETFESSIEAIVEQQGERIEFRVLQGFKS